LLAVGGALVRSGAGAAVSQTAKGAIKNNIKQKALGAAKSKLFGSKKKKISKDKLLGKSQEGLVKYNGNQESGKKPSSIIKRPESGITSLKTLKNNEETDDSKSVSSPFESILKELSNIKSSLENIQSSINSEISSISDKIKQQRVASFKQKAKDKESRLEEKNEKDVDENEKDNEKKEPPSIFERILNFLGNILIGSLLNWGLNYLPQITEAFNAVIDAFQNPLKRLKFAIITLTTVFPRFTRKVLSFGRKLFFGPARFIGGLIFKAGSLVKNLFIKAGQAIFNIIKEPLKKILGPAATNILKGISGGVGSVAKKGVARSATRAAAVIGGPGAAKVVSGTTNSIAKTAPAVFKRLKTFSKVFKRVPIIGALIGIGIDLAMGEPLDRAIVGAAGASFGSLLGAAIGQGLIPIPVVGAAIGGFIGAGVGDWASKSFYEYLKGKTSEAESEVKNDVKVQSAAKGGTVNQIETTRKTSVEKRKFVERKVQRIPTYEKSSRFEQNFIKESKENIFKGENSTKRFVRISDAFRSIPLVGEVMNLGIAIGMGKKITDSDARSSADQIANSIGLSIQNNQIKGIDPDMAGTISMGLSQWARNEILNQLRRKQGSFEIKDTDKDASSDGSVIDAGQNGPIEDPTGEVQPSDYPASNDEAFKKIFDIAVKLGDPVPELTAAQAMFESGWLKSPKAKLDNNPFGQTGSGTAGKIWSNNRWWARYKTYDDAVKSRIERWANSTPKGGPGYASKGGAPLPGLLTILETYAPGSENNHPNYISGVKKILVSYGFDPDKKNSPTQLKMQPGQTQAGVSGGRRGSANPVATSSRTPSLTNNPSVGAPGSGKGKKIYLHWAAAQYASNPSGWGYHSSFDNMGKKTQIRPYTQRSNHTDGRNTNSVGIAAAAMGGASPSKWGKFPPTNSQISAMAAESAALAKAWGWRASDITKSNVMTHAEAARADGYYLGSGDSQERWDFDTLRQGATANTGGNEFRNMIRAAMGSASSTPPNVAGGTTRPVNEESSTSTSTSNSAPVQEESSSYDSTKAVTILGDPSNETNKGYGSGRKGGGDMPFDNYMKKESNKSLNTNETESKPKSFSSIGSPNIISRSSNINVSPLNIRASYDSPQSTIVMMQLPQQNNSRPEISTPSRGGMLSIPNSSIDLYKQVLTKALF
jgi:hypothetical protein